MSPLTLIILGLAVTNAVAWVPGGIQAHPHQYSGKLSMARSVVGKFCSSHAIPDAALVTAKSSFAGFSLALPSDKKFIEGTDGGAGDRRSKGSMWAAVRFPRFRLRKRDSVRTDEREPGPPVYRSVERIEKYPRYPMWPVQNGLILAVLDALKLDSLAQWLEELCGGRACPMMLNTEEQDPFILMVHHRHSFWPFDPISPLVKLLIPDGFPAHGHRGFQTVTYMLKGSMTHRDSLGLKQTYGAGSVQWLNAGRGIIHEEMWGVIDWVKTDAELYQIWVNLPSHLKMTSPRIQLVGQGTNSPLPKVSPSKGTEVVVIAGEVGGARSPVDLMQPLSMVHVAMEPGAEPFVHRVPEGHRCAIYVRAGDLTVVPTREGYFEGEDDREPQVVGVHHTAFLAQDGGWVQFENRGSSKLDFFAMAGAPTGEPVVARGPIVMNTEAEVDQAYADMQNGLFGQTWDHRLNDDQWRESLQGGGHSQR